MKRIMYSVVAAGVMGVAAFSLADSNQMPPSTQPTTQQGLSGQVLSSVSPPPATKPSGKPAIDIPPSPPTDGAGAKPGGVMLNNGIGPTVAPTNNGTVSSQPNR